LVIERPFFLRVDEKPLFGMIYYPESGARDGVIICDSLFEEKFWCERVCANLGRYLAERGIAVLSFDYYGYGNSGGDSEDVTVVGLLDDIDYACNYMSELGISSLSLVGIRWGGGLAIEVAEKRSDVGNVFLVEPVVDWKKELMNALRANVAGQYAIFKKAVMTRDEIVRRLKSGDDCTYNGYRMNNIDGYIISRDFFEQSEQMKLVEWDEHIDSNVVIYELPGKKDVDQSKYQRLCEHLGDSSRSCLVKTLENVNPFWTNYRTFTSTAEELYRDILSVISEETLDSSSGDGDRQGLDSAKFIDSGKVSSDGVVAKLPETVVNDGIIEEIVTLKTHEGHKMYGILYQAEGSGGGNVGVVFTHGGLIGMNGAFRFNTRAARRFAKAGIVSLCFDPHGMGRAQGTIGNVDQRILFRKIQSGLFSDDVGIAVNYMRERFTGRKISVFGVCGGAITNIIAHGKYEIISSSVLLSIPVMLSGLSHEAVRMSNGYAKFYLGMYVRKIFSPTAWLRFLTFRSEYKKIFTALGVYLSSFFKKVFNAGKGQRSRTRETKEERSRRASLIKKTSAVTGSSLEFNEHFLAAFRSIVSRKSPGLFIFGENDNFKWEFYSEFVERFPEEWKAGEAVFSVEIIPHANHMYTLGEWQDQIVDLCIDWMGRVGKKDKVTSDA